MKTKDALNRTIAEWIEPMPAEPPKWSHEESPLKAWKCKFTGYSHRDFPPNQVGYPEPIYIWQPADFHTDPAASFALLKKMAEVLTVPPDYYFTLAFTGGKWWPVQMRIYNDGNADMPQTCTPDPDPMTAIALAAETYIDSQKEGK